MTTQSYCIVYRTGGTENFQWHRSLEMSHGEALSRVQEMQRGGHTCYCVNYRQSVAIGLPSTFAGSAWELADAKRKEKLA